jgi:spore maturation protein SpmB
LLVQGSIETTFHATAVYLGGRNSLRAAQSRLLADLAAVITSIAVCYWFFA